MKRFLTAISLVLALCCTPALANEAQLVTGGDYLAYLESLERLNAGLTRQEIADLNWQLTVLAYGEKPAAMTDEDYVLNMMTFLTEHPDVWLKRLAPYDGWTAEQLMALEP